MTEMTSRSPSAQATGRYVVQYDRLDTQPLSVAIVDAVATFRNRDVTELEPLHYAIDTDALERLFEPRADGLRDGGSVTFEYSDCLVTITAAGEIRIDSA